jgi:hypothetical protein
MNEVLILIGIIMVIAGIFVYYMGNKRAVPNTFLWAAFPILHGLHEFMDYALQFKIPFFFERLEIFFAIAGSFVLLAAAIEYNGVVTRPIGKIGALIGLITISYFIFGLPEDILEAMDHFNFKLGFLSTTPFRYFQGFFMTILAMVAIVLTSLYLIVTSKNGRIAFDKKSVRITGISIVILSIYAFFEGFESEDPIFVTLRAISLSLFIVVPIFFILVNRIGLQKLLIIQEGGVPLLGYDFLSHNFISLQSSEILAAGFLSAISHFSNEFLKAGTSFSLRSKQIYFILAHIEGTIYTLQSLHTNKNLEKVFYDFANKINPFLKKSNTQKDVDLSIVRTEIHNAFNLFY